MSGRVDAMPAPSVSLDAEPFTCTASGVRPWDHATRPGGMAEPRGGNKTVLVVASRFPPVASVGAIRVRKFVKYLVRFGWRPVVITGAMRRCDAGSHDVRRATDFGSLSDIPDGLPVHRLDAALDDWPGHSARSWAKRLARLTSPFSMDAGGWESALKWRFQRVHDRLAFPDRGIWRLSATVRLALALHRRHRFNAVFTSGMPFSDHVIGLVLQTMMRRPWLADFRDPWVEYAHWRQWRTEWGGRLVGAAESAVVSRASFVISVNTHMTGRFAARYPTQRARKFVTIENGFDPDDFKPAVQESGRRHFRLLYAGSLFKTRSPAAVLEAFRCFLDAVPGSRTHARFDFAGRPGPFLDDLVRIGADAPVQYIGLLSHAAALRAMVSADVNVVMLPNRPGGGSDTTAKVYECLGSGRPVLAAVPPDGSAARVLRGFDQVWLRHPDDVKGIAEDMMSLYRSWLAGTLRVRRPSHGLRRYTRVYQARQLAACLDAAISSGRRRVGVRL